MKILGTIVASALLALGIAGCAMHNDRLKLDLPMEQKAVVLGLDETKLMIGVERDLSFTAVDGNNTFRGWGKGYPVSVELTPGRHKLTALYRITDQGAPGPTGEITTEIEVRAGRTYRSDLYLEDGRWQVRYLEITDAELRAQEERRAKIRAEQFDS